VFGIVVMLWSYFGTNMLGIGLHAYASAEGVGTFIFTEILFTALAIATAVVPYERETAPPRPLAAA